MKNSGLISRTKWKSETGNAAFDFHMESPAFVAGRESKNSKNENVGHKQRSDLNE